MKNFMQKLSAIGISLTLLFGNFLPYYTTVQPLQAETTLDSNTLGGFIILWLAGMGISINSQGPNLNCWVNDEFEKWKKLNYDQVDLDNLAARQQEQKLSYDKAFLQIGSVLYNAYSGFASYLQKTFSINKSSSNVIVGNVTFENYFSFTLSQEPTNLGSIISSSNKGNELTIWSVNDVSIPCRMVTLNTAFGYSSYLFSDVNVGDVRTNQRIPVDSSFHQNNGLKINSKFYIYDCPPYTLTSLIPYFDGDISLYPWSNENVALAYKYAYGDFALDDRQVLADGNVKLDDRVITTSKDATLDLSKLVSMDGVTTTDQLMDILKQWTLDNSYPADYPLADAEATTDEPSDVPSDIVNGKVEGLTSVFPFCVPYDVKAFFDVLVADPVAPKWTFHLDYYEMKYDLTLNLADFESVFVVFRYGMLGLFILGLILITREIVGGE